MGGKRYITHDSHGEYRTVYRSFGVNVPYWIWRLTPSAFQSMELSTPDPSSPSIRRLGSEDE